MLGSSRQSSGIMGAEPTLNIEINDFFLGSKLSTINIKMYASRVSKHTHFIL